MLSPAQIGEINARHPLRALAQTLGAVFRGKGRVGSCPICGGGKSATRFEVFPDGQSWACAVCADGGDAIKLVMRVKHLGFAEAVAELGGALRLSAGEERRLRAKREADEARREAEANKYRERMRRELFALWQASPPFLGTPVEAYLRGRGLSWRLDELELRCAPDLPYCEGHTPDETGRNAPRVIHRGPAMLAAFVGPDGRFLSLHRTWIDPERPGRKAEIFDPETGEALPAKKMIGHKQGGFLKLVRGKPPFRIVAGEGIETTLSVREAMRDEGAYATAQYRAAGDLGNLCGAAVESVAHPSLKTKAGRALRVGGAEPDLSREAMPVPGECRELELLMDGDSDPFTTELAMRRALARFSRPGRAVWVRSPGRGCDFNDMLVGAA